MNKFIKILWLPVVILTMALTGAFTANAGNIVTEDNQPVKVEEQAQTPYTGELYYKVGNTYPLANVINSGDCTFVTTGEPYFEEVEGNLERMYGWDAVTSSYHLLFKITE